ncbi:origin recognition complex subunit [Xylariales sp. PMI_506]|nr:origin recognition complex subunit [Xylariales sp. PMI_506]
MEENTDLGEAFADREHQAAYIFDPSEDAGDGVARPVKRRKVSKKHDKNAENEEPAQSKTSFFQPLLDGSESQEGVALRQKLFEESWSVIEKRIDHVLRDANRSTLEDVTSFIQGSTRRAAKNKIPAAFIITGANIASQELLFEQLAETLADKADAKVVRLHSGDATNLKAALKKIIRDTTSRAAEDEGDSEVSVGKDGRKFLNYDLEALHSYLKTTPRTHVTITFQDSEAFESALLSDLILLISSWLDRIPFTLLFGVATSVELFQARLLKSTCNHLYGGQFDMAQSTSVIERIFKAAIAHTNTPLSLGPGLLQSLLERQRDQVAGIPMFISSVKYAYMSHFYANPLSILLSDELDDSLLQKEHLEVVRSLPSFRSFVEAALQLGDVERARELLDDDTYLRSRLRQLKLESDQWTRELLRKVEILIANKSINMDFVQTYLEALANGIDVAGEHVDFLDSVRRMPPSEAISFLTQVINTIETGDESLGLEAWADESQTWVTVLSEILAEMKTLQTEASENETTLKSKYSSQSRVLRTTVVAQKVQLSQDTAALTDGDKAYTDLVDRTVDHLGMTLKASRAEDLFLHEAWLYDFKSPYKDVFIPRPRAVIERALLRPHDYLSCSCCRAKEGEIKPSLPSTAILYKLYLETGSLINVADLWSAYYGVVSEGNEDGVDERIALVHFYRAMAELKTMGFVKQSRKKADHIAKLAWRGL